MSAETGVSFQDCAIVACGTLTLELNHLRKSGFLNARRIEYTKPGRHEVPKELESQLVDRIGKAKSYAESVIVVYGGKFCFIDINDPGGRSKDKPFPGSTPRAASICLPTLKRGKRFVMVKRSSG